MKPSREEIEEAIRYFTSWDENLQPTDGVLMKVQHLRDLVTAARWALELVDPDNPPLLPEDMKGLKRRHPRKPK